MKYGEMSMGAFADALAAKTPVPGGGSASAAVAAMGAALGVMAMRFSDAEGSAETIGRLERIRERLMSLSDEDAAAYGKVTDAFAMPKGDPDQKRRRQEAVQSAMVGAARVPLETMRVCLEAVEMIGAFLPKCNPNLRSDCVCGMNFLRAGLSGASENVKINAESVKDQSVASRLREEALEISGRAEAVTGDEG